MSEWTPGRLSDVIVSLNAGVSVNSDDRLHGSGEVGVLKTSALCEGRFNPTEHKTVKPEERRRVAEPVRGDTVLLSRMNTPELVGEACYVRVDHPTLFLPDRLWQLEPISREVVSMRWLSFVLRSPDFRRHVNNHATGTSGSMKNLPKAAVKAYRLALPTVDEQTLIAGILDTLDTQIEKTQALIAKLEQVKEGLLQDLLTRGVDENGELRPSVEEAPELYKASPLGLIPKDWGGATLESVSHAVTSGSRDWACFYADTGALFVRIGNLTREHINLRFDSAIYVRPPANADGQRTRLEAGDILISITADLGIVGVVSQELGEAYINQHIALVRPNFDEINPRFVGHYLAGEVAQTYIRKLNDAGAKAGLNLPTIRRLMTAKPPRCEQNFIAERVDEIDGRVQDAKTESAKLSALKAGLMDDLLTGHVRVTSLLESLQPATSA